MKNKQALIRVLPLLFWMILVCNGCFKNVAKRNVAYFNDFEEGFRNNITILDSRGVVDSLHIKSYNGSKVLGFFNNNRVSIAVKNLAPHNALKIEFDLYIHGLWDGDFLRPGTNIPDVWQMHLDNFPFYLTTFSNGSKPQSFPNNYDPTGKGSPARGDSWNANLPGICATEGLPGGTSLYKIEKITSHTADSLVVFCSDVLQPFNSLCSKSWSIDNIRLTVTKH